MKVWRVGWWRCFSCGNHHPLRTQDTTRELDRQCRSCGRRNRRRMTLIEPWRSGITIEWRPAHIPWRRVVEECRDRNRHNRQKKAKARAREHGESIEDWADGSGFRTASSRRAAIADATRRRQERLNQIEREALGDD